MVVAEERMTMLPAVDAQYALLLMRMKSCDAAAVALSSFDVEGLRHSLATAMAIVTRMHARVVAL